MSFLIGFAGSLLAAVVFTVVASVVSKKARWVLATTLGRMINVDIEFVFPNKAEAEADVKREVERSRQVRLLTGRGNELQRGTFETLLSKGRAGGSRQFEVLLPDYRSTEGQESWIQKREQELATFDPAYGHGLLSSDVEKNVTYLKGYIGSGALTLKLYDYPNIGRILLTERAAYLTPYCSYRHGREDPVVKLRRGGELYAFLERIYDSVSGAAERVLGSEDSSG
jgi:hypothetical protein